MDTVALRYFAQQLLQHEANQTSDQGKAIAPEWQTFEKLRLHISKIVGVPGFQALLRRALAQGLKEAPMLASLSVRSDGSLERYTEFALADAKETVEVLLTHLLGLLVTFVGEKLTVQLLQDVWPDVPLSKLH